MHIYISIYYTYLYTYIGVFLYGEHHHRAHTHAQDIDKTTLSRHANHTRTAQEEKRRRLQY